MNNPRIYGNPPFTVAVVHGGPGAAGEMAPVARALAKGRGVLEPLQTAVSLRGQLVELKDLLVQYADFPVTLIGFSWGAWLGYLIAAHHRALVRKLILVGSGPFEEKYATDIQQIRLSRLSAGDRAEIESLLEVFNKPGDRNKNPVFAKLGKLFSKADAYDPIETLSEELDCRADIFNSVWPEGAELRKSGELLAAGKKIRCPVVAIHGDHDPHPAEGIRKPLADILDNFHFILLPNCGHMPWIERGVQKEFYKIIEGHL